MFDAIPAGLDTMEPGLVLGILLSGIDVDRVSGYDRIVILRAEQRMAAHYAARSYAAMVSVVEAMEHGDFPDTAEEDAAAEIQAALRYTRRAADGDLSLAIDLRRRLPAVFKSLESGRIDVRRAWVIVNGVAHLDQATARRVADQIIDDAGRLTTGQLHALISRLAIGIDPDTAARRYEHAVSDRRLVLEPTTDGTANLMGLDLPPQRAAAITRRINRIARCLHTAAETRTMDQLCADIYLDLLAGRSFSGTKDRPVVDLRIDLTTLAGLDDQPAEIAGYGPIIADIARRTVDPDAEWRYTVTHPDTGRPLTTGVTRRRPTSAQTRSVNTAAPDCIFPGCRAPASACDLDHATPWSQGGPTTPDNLEPLCRHHHTVRHHGWTHDRLPDGDHRWTTPLGHVHTTTGRPP